MNLLLFIPVRAGGLRVWRKRAREAAADLSGRTPELLLDALEAWPLVTEPMAEKETGAPPEELGPAHRAGSGA